jgi:hypothetical protein
MTAEQADLLKKIAAFPLEEQNTLKRDHDVIYSFNGWKLTVGDVKLAREMQPASTVAPSENHAQIAELKETIEDLRSTMNAWFDFSKKTEEDVTPILTDGLKLYLRRSRSGGMPTKLANAVEAVLVDFCRLYVGNLLLPVLRGLAAPASPSDEADRIQLLQARYVLLALNKERPDCGYGKLADACQRIAVATTPTPSHPESAATTGAPVDGTAPHLSIDPDLVQRAREILEWRRTGRLHNGSGGAMRELAKRLEEQGIGDSHSLGVAEENTNKEAMAVIVRLAAALAITSELPQVTWWNGRRGPAIGLAESLEAYATVQPGGDRDKWAMKAAAEWIRQVVALHDPTPQNTAEATPDEAPPTP